MSLLTTYSEVYTQAISLRNFLQTHLLSNETSVFLADADSVRLLKLLDLLIDGVEELFAEQSSPEAV